MKTLYRVFLGALLSLVIVSGAQAQEMPLAPEDVYQGEVVNYPGPWAFHIPRSHIILVSDGQLDALTNPDQEVDLGISGTPNLTTLRKICEQAQAGGRRTLIFAFDHFFSQYRPDLKGQERQYTPDTDTYIERLAKISAVAKEYGIGLELSLLSPLEIGPGYAKQTGESGVWMHYRKGVRDPKSGAYSVQLWKQERWSNNKGPISIVDAGVRVFAFSERKLGGTPYRVVDPNGIVEISDTAQVEVYEGLASKAGDFESVRIRVHGTGRADIGELNRVLIVQQYKTPEMDYFSESALPFLKGLVDRYVDAGVKLNGLYSDEMHIQQDWGYFSHHDHGEFALRYVSPGLANRFAAAHGAQFTDFAKYLVYFCHGQDDWASDLTAKEDTMHVFGDSPTEIRATALFRANYYRLLQDGVVDLFVAAKRHAETRTGHRLEARAHATWAESPTIDSWRSGPEPHQRHQYEYTSNFVWSDTVHQSASACSDYFKWGDFLTGNGNDHAEGGWLDRNYFALALACSTGILNEVPYSYGAHWGMPDEISRRRQALVNVYGASAHPGYGMVQGMEHRDVDVLMLYPLDLVAVDERFGSWMSQYGYANQITAAKLLERGTVVNGAVEVAGRRFTTIATQFEPFPAKALLDMMGQLVEQGGRVIWSGPPPVLTQEGEPALPAWCDLFGVDYAAGRMEGFLAPGKQVSFSGALAGVPPQIILTDFLVDRIYPVSPREGATPCAQVGPRVVGTHRAHASGGQAVFLGFRPRDDQSKSLTYEVRTWFETLSALGAYGPSGAANDNTEYVSRTTPWLACRFPNGAVALAPHLRELEEGWPGGFIRKPEEDQKVVAGLTLPSERITLQDFAVNGHTVSYEGDGAVTFRVDAAGKLIGFAGGNCAAITIDGTATQFSEAPLPFVAWAPVQEYRRKEGGAVVQLMVYGQGTLRIPAAGLPEAMHFVTEGPTPGSRGTAVAHRREDDSIVIEIGPGASGPWIYGVGGEAAQL
ncbi:MAG: hypothetical protein HYV27_21895 [Candidatus Hydrogenedentes bacterium]|nr:hypothetical protein [Candidatus Hydrogenedentota bacterium]